MIAHHMPFADHARSISPLVDTQKRPAVRTAPADQTPERWA